MSKSSTTIDTSDWLDIPHAGELLASEFMEPLELNAAALANAIEVDAARLRAVIDGEAQLGGEFELDLAARRTYFRHSKTQIQSRIGSNWGP